MSKPSSDNNNFITFRAATEQDGPQILEMVTQILTKYGLKQIQDPSDNIDDDLLNIEKYYFTNNGYLEIVELNSNSSSIESKIIASCGIYKLSESKCELRKMYLREEYRGKGLGRKLLERAIEKAKEMNYKQMELETASVLVEALALYEKFGFSRVIDCEDKHLCSRCDIIMIKDLV
ncbi:acetyltransferase [Naegleria gruberi]|uniref:Acetyltransferase n=1 Tax=Naegleria gruberi TaxID=5762 RepID=D2VXX9_NAEGR|nr:acetyltransferase [Naegleria gruberi]XP_002671060.1 acetyltransferase [Naegleria gruberi]EFC35982.1 acetyltransferase [Naegleria gruberi]EFC38316.1 acetyltransferase [Naegleria gruberi]|eukprot:XP_002668726.1 acetyltransferase [Naegleria gruberi strain NEG-M]